MSALTDTERRPVSTAGRRRFRPPGRGWLGVPVVAYLLMLLVFRVILIGLYSVGLKTNVVYPPISYSWSDWKGFLPFLHSGPESVYFQRFTLSIKITLIVSVSAVILAYPPAFFLAFVAPRHRSTLLMGMLAPFFTNYLLRIYAWTVMLPGHGTVNSALELVGLVDSNNPITL